MYTSTYKRQNDISNVGISLLVSIPQCKLDIISPITGDVTMLEKAKSRDIHHGMFLLLVLSLSIRNVYILF